MFRRVHVLLCLLLAAVLASAAAANAQETPDVASDQAPAPAHVGPDNLYPNPALTPGAVFDAVTAEQVCAVGYSAAVRNVTAAERAQVYAEYGLEDVPGADEVDHFIPLELGGSNDITNLWPEPYVGSGARTKDRVENYLHQQVCDGLMTLSDAQQLIVRDWYAVYASLSPAPAPVAPAPAVVPVEPVAPVGTVVQSVPPTGHEVRFVTVSGGGPGGRASVSVQTVPGATCWVQYVTPAGTKSTAQGQGIGVTRSVSQDGSASWSWVIGSATRPGVGSVTATCSTATATTSITIGN